ncbi:MAG: lanthionine synthetase C family protein [Chlamydiales bacterium]
MESALISSEQLLLFVKKIAEPMRNPEWVKSIVLSKSNLNPDPLFDQSYWSDVSLASGYPGVLLLLVELDSRFPDERWDAAIHAHILKIKESIESFGISYFPLYGGLTGVCFSLQQASKNGTRYQSLIATLNAYLIDKIAPHYLFPLQKNLDAFQPSPPALYDVVQGIVGIGVYALLNFNQPAFRDLAIQIIRLLIALTHPIKITDNIVPGWYTPLVYQFLEKDKKLYPAGNFNLGLAHGAPGILAFLSVALLHGVEIQGQREAMQRVVDWLYNYRSEKDHHVFWQARISFEEQISGIREEISFFPRDAWCYGTPGVARSLFLAGKALENEELKMFAFRAFLTIFDRDRSQWHLPGPTLCHGISGLLMITRQMAQDTQSSELHEKTSFLKKILLEYYQPQYPFGFRDLEPSKNGKNIEIDKAGFLEGAAGTLLSLIDDPCSNWYAPLLISDRK